MYNMVVNPYHILKKGCQSPLPSIIDRPVASNISKRDIEITKQLKTVGNIIWYNYCSRFEQKDWFPYFYFS